MATRQIGTARAGAALMTLAAVLSCALVCSTAQAGLEYLGGPSIGLTEAASSAATVEHRGGVYVALIDRQFGRTMLSVHRYEPRSRAWQRVGNPLNTRADARVEAASLLSTERGALYAAWTEEPEGGSPRLMLARLETAGDDLLRWRPVADAGTSPPVWPRFGVQLLELEGRIWAAYGTPDGQQLLQLEDRGWRLSPTRPFHAPVGLYLPQDVAAVGRTLYTLYTVEVHGVPYNDDQRGHIHPEIHRVLFLLRTTVTGEETERRIIGPLTINPIAARLALGGAGPPALVWRDADRSIAVAVLTAGEDGIRRVTRLESELTTGLAAARASGGIAVATTSDGTSGRPRGIVLYRIREANDAERSRRDFLPTPLAARPSDRRLTLIADPQGRPLLTYNTPSNAAALLYRPEPPS